MNQFSALKTATTRKFWEDPVYALIYTFLESNKGTPFLRNLIICSIFQASFIASSPKRRRTTKKTPPTAGLNLHFTRDTKKITCKGVHFKTITILQVLSKNSS